MSDPLTDLVAFLADRLDVPTGDVRAAMEEAERDGVMVLRVIDEPADDLEAMAMIRDRGRGACLCPISTIERVMLGCGTCGRGGCPYGGDI